MYVIAGNYYSKGIVGDDASTLSQYWELGWECGVSNVYIKHYLDIGRISKKDTVVTRNSREFFYSSVFDNVIDWETYQKIKTDSDKVISIPDELDITNLLNYDYAGVNIDLVCDFDLDPNIENKYNIDSEFVIICVRLRDHGAYRNTDINVAIKLIEYLKSEGYEVFIVGHGSKFLESQYKVRYLDLLDYASLTNSRYCKLCVSTLSGIIHLPCFTGHKNLNAFVLDHYGERNQNNHPIYMGDNINYKNIKTKFINGPENFEVIKSLFDQIR